MLYKNTPFSFLPQVTPYVFPKTDIVHVYAENMFLQTERSLLAREAFFRIVHELSKEGLLYKLILNGPDKNEGRLKFVVSFELEC